MPLECTHFFSSVGTDVYLAFADETTTVVQRLAVATQTWSPLGAGITGGFDDRAVQLLVRWHHEWFGGGGYPDALRGEQIPLGARILRVADAYAALTDARPWRPAGVPRVDCRPA